MTDIVELFSKAKPGDIICIPSSNLYRYFGSSDEASAFINHIVYQADRHGLTVTIECDPCMDEYKIVITAPVASPTRDGAEYDIEDECPLSHFNLATMA